jgi:hypothetical protein
MRRPRRFQTLNASVQPCEASTSNPIPTCNQLFHQPAPCGGTANTPSIMTAAVLRHHPSWPHGAKTPHSHRSAMAEYAFTKTRLSQDRHARTLTRLDSHPLGLLSSCNFLVRTSTTHRRSVETTWNFGPTILCWGFFWVLRSEFGNFRLMETSETPTPECVMNHEQNE